jgi:thiol-disulfide isomerase/thioredoxin
MTTPRNNSKSSLWKILAPAGVILAFVIAGLLVIKSEFSRPPRNSGPIEVGATLPDFTLTRLDGTTTLVSQVRAKVMLINFWATWCEACVEEMPSIIQLREAYKNRGFEVLGVNLDENPEVVAPKIAKQLKMEFPLFKDPEGIMGDLFDIHAIPLTVILDSQRKILYMKDGELNWNSPAVRTQIERWISG